MVIFVVNKVVQYAVFLIGSASGPDKKTRQSALQKHTSSSYGDGVCFFKDHGNMLQNTVKLRLKAWLAPTVRLRIGFP